MIAPTSYVIDENKADVTFTRKASDAQLDSIRLLMAARGAELNYTSVKKDGNLLNELAFTLTYGGHTGMARTNFVNLRGRPFGYYLEFGQGGKFVVGEK